MQTLGDATNIPMANDQKPALDTRIPLAGDSKLPMEGNQVDPLAVQAKQLSLADAEASYAAKKSTLDTQAQDKQVLEMYMKSGGSFATPDSMEEGLKEIGSKLSPEGQLNLQKALADRRLGDIEMRKTIAGKNIEEIKANGAALDETARTMMPLVEAYNKELEAATTPEAKTVALQKFEAGKAAGLQYLAGVIPPEKLKTLVPMDPDHLRDFIKGADYVANVHKDIAEENLKASQTRAADAMADWRKEKTAEMPAELAAKLKKMEANGGSDADITPEERKLAVGAWIQSPAGLRGMGPAYQRNVVKWAADLGITPEDALSGRAAQKFDMAAATASGNRAGRMASVEATMPRLIKNAREAAAAVDRSTFVPFNKLSQMVDSAIGDPALRALKLANQAVSSEYQQVIARGGSNVTALKEAMDLLQTADSPEAYEAALSMVEKEIKANVQGSKDVRASIGTGAAAKLAAPTPTAFPHGSPGDTEKGKAERLKILTDEKADIQARIDSAKTPEDKTRAEAELVDINKELGRAGIAPAAPSAAKPTVSGW